MKQKLLHDIRGHLVCSAGFSLLSAQRRLKAGLRTLTLCFTLGILGLAAPVARAQEVTVFVAQAQAQTSPAPLPQYWIGVAVENVGQNVADWLNLSPGQGLMVSKVIKDSPAQAAGLQVNDLLLEINGKPLMAQRQLIATAQPVLENGVPTVHPLTVVYQRKKDRRSVVITPQQRPPAYEVVSAIPTPQGMVPMNANGPITGTNRVPLRNGGFINIGPGYRLDLNVQAAGMERHQIQQLMQGGQCVIISQSADLQGHIKTSITSSGKTYDITADNLDTLPADVRALAQSLGITSPHQEAAPIPPGADNATNAAALAKKISAQQDEIARLKNQLDALAQQLQKPPETQPAPPQ